MKKKEMASIGRRDFFRKAGLGAGAVSAAAAGLAAGTARAAEPSAKTSEAAGYRETAHVKKYYELSRF